MKSVTEIIPPVTEAATDSEVRSWRYGYLAGREAQLEEEQRSLEYRQWRIGQTGEIPAILRQADETAAVGVEGRS